MIMQTMKEIFEEIETDGGMTPSRRLRDIANRFPEQIAFRLSLIHISEPTRPC